MLHTLWEPGRSATWVPLRFTWCYRKFACSARLKEKDQLLPRLFPTAFLNLGIGLESAITNHHSQIKNQRRLRLLEIASDFLAAFKCTPYSLPFFVYRTSFNGEPIPVSNSTLLSHFAPRLSIRLAARFLLWWLFLHRRLRSRQRGLPTFACRRLSLLSGGSLPSSAFRFYPDGLRSPFSSLASQAFRLRSRA